MSSEHQMKDKRASPIRRKRGRPPSEPIWLRTVAEAVGRGISLRRALWREGVYGLTENQMRNIYRWVKFNRYLDEARLEHFRQYGRVPKRHGSRAARIERLLAMANAPTIEDLLRGG